MTSNLPSIPNVARAAWSIIKAVGPWAISLTEKGSESFAQHHLRLAHVEACKELMLGEIRTLSEVRRKLTERYYDSPDEERFRIKRDLLDLEKETRRLGVYQQALAYLPEEAATGSTSSNNPGADGSISAPWVDRFNEIAQLQNESWRQELLSKALALEAQNPGSISPRALWFIGTVDEHVFHAFASLIDVSSIIVGRYMIPNHTGYYDRLLPNCALGDNIKLGNATFLLNELGVIGDLLTSQRHLAHDAIVQVAYGEEVLTLRMKNEVRVSGIVLTPLGDMIASLYEQKPNALGKEIFGAWVESIKSRQAEVVPA